MIENFKSFRVYVLVECPACKRAVNLLKSKQKVFSVTVLDNDQEYLSTLKEEYNWKTVPLIIGKTDDEKEVFLGGCSDLEKMFDV